MHGAKISAIEYYLPTGILTSQEAASKNALPESTRVEKLGIQQIHRAAENETPSSMAAEAINKLCTNSALDKKTIEFLILVTQNPDHNLPTTACITQHLAGLPTNILAYDINQGCSGFVVALAQASSLIKCGMFSKGIVVTAEAYNRIISPEDKDTFGLFGDAAAATLLERCAEDEGLMGFSFGSDGSGANHLIRKNGGAVCAIDSSRDDFLYMNGRAIYNFVTLNLPHHIQTFLDQQTLDLNSVDHWYFHQANKFMNSKLCSLLQISPENAYFDISSIGNTVSSSIPIAIKKSQEADLPLPSTSIFCGFGVGLSWGSCLYKNLQRV